MHKSVDAVQAIRRTALKMPQVISSEQLSLLADEWKLYQAENIPEEWYVLNTGSTDGAVKYSRIDDYWMKIFGKKTSSGTPMFTVLQKFVKASLCLTHGNAEVERSVSVSKRVLNPERTLLSDDSINALRSTKDAVRVLGSGQAHLMHVAPTMREARSAAYAMYRKHLD